MAPLERAAPLESKPIVKYRIFTKMNTAKCGFYALVCLFFTVRCGVYCPSPTLADSHWLPLLCVRDDEASPGQSALSFELTIAAEPAL